MIENFAKIFSITLVLGFCWACTGETQETQETQELDTGESDSEISNTFVAKSDPLQFDYSAAEWDLARRDDGSTVSEFTVEMRTGDEIWQFRIMDFELEEQYDLTFESSSTLGFYIYKNNEGVETGVASSDGYIRFEREGVKIRGTGVINVATPSHATKKFSFEGPISFICTDNLAGAGETLFDNQFCRETLLNMEKSRE